MILSHSPLHATYEPSAPEAECVEEEDEFDWTSYLMEGIEYSPEGSSGSEVQYKGKFMACFFMQFLMCPMYFAKHKFLITLFQHK